MSIESMHSHGFYPICVENNSGMPVEHPFGETKYSPVVRVFPVCMRPTETIRAEMEAAQAEGYSLASVDLNHIPLMRKSSDSVPSAHMLTPIGGKIRSDESILAAGLRELGEESTAINPIGHIPSADTKDGGEESIGQYSYVILKPGSGRNRKPYKRNQEQLVHNIVMECASLPGREPDILQPSVDKAKSIEFYTVREAVDLINGQTDGMIEGSRKGMTYAIGQRIDQIVERHVVLSETVETIVRLERNTQIKLINAINSLRVTNGDNRHALSLDDPSLTIDEIVEAYEHVRISTVMRSYRQDEKSEIAALRGSQQPEATNEPSRVQHLKKELGPLLGKDLLAYAQVFAQIRTENISAVSARTTRTVIHAMNYLKRTVADSLEQCDHELAQGIRAGGSKAETIAVINDLASRYPRLTFHEKQMFDFAFDELVAARLSQDFGVSPQELREIHQSAIELIDRLVDTETSRAEVVEAEQWHDVLEEIRHANIGQLLLMCLGVNQHAELSSVYQELFRFEASKALAILMKGLSIYPDWNSKRIVSQKFFSDLYTRIFGHPIRSDHVQILLSDGTLQNREVDYRRDSVHGEVILDEVPTKDFTSFLRKSFESPTDAIQDVYRFNIGLGDDDIARQLDEESFELYAKYKVIRAFDTGDLLAAGPDVVGSFAHALGPEYTVKIVDRRNTYLPFLEHLDSGEEPDTSTGIRAGSKASRIVREKFKIKVTGKTPQGTDFVSYCEVSCNPMLQIAGETHGRFMGLLDKIADVDFYLERITEPLTHFSFKDRKSIRMAGYPSLYSLLYPAHLYNQPKDILKSRLTRKKKESGD